MPHLVGGAGVEPLDLVREVMVIERQAVAGVELHQVERLQAAELLPLVVHPVELPELLSLVRPGLVIELQAVASSGPRQAAGLLRLASSGCC